MIIDADEPPLHKKVLKCLKPFVPATYCINFSNIVFLECDFFCLVPSNFKLQIELFFNVADPVLYIYISIVLQMASLTKVRPFFNAVDIFPCKYFAATAKDV